MAASGPKYAKNNLAPGVHFQELPPRPERELKTGVPLFVGFGEVIHGGKQKKNDRLEKLQADSASVCRFSLWEQFAAVTRISGEGFLDYAVRGFFENGGKHCVVVLLPYEDSGYAQAAAISKLFEEEGPLEEIEGVDLVGVPDIMKGDILACPGLAADLQQQVLAYCRRMGDRFAILDSIAPDYRDEEVCAGRTVPAGEDAVCQALQWQMRFIYRGRAVEGAIYFPWLLVPPLSRHAGRLQEMAPPSGHVAGIIARTDRSFGVHKAPANAVVEGATDLAFSANEDLAADLNRVGINCIRSFPGRGIRVWGARTLSTLLDWKYVNVRRLFLTLVRWSEHNLDDLVFQPNAPPLWDRVRDRIGSYCVELFELGALAGNLPVEGFFVKCDKETNPDESVREGKLICEVGLAPVSPAEFVIVRITRTFAGTTTAKIF